MKKHANPLKNIAQSLTSFIAASAKAKRSSDIGILSQLVELARLRRPPNCISPSEYYDFNLYDSQKFDWAAKKSFLGWRSPVIPSLQEPHWHALANDKLAYYGLMTGLGFQIPSIFAIYHKGERFFGDVPVFKDTDLLADFLRTNCPFPFYGKPVHGLYGEGNVLCTAYSPETDSLRMASGGLIKVGDFVSGLLDRSNSGYLFQQVLKGSSGITALFGDRLSTVRIVISLTLAGPKVVIVEWKIPTGDNIIDNYHDGSTGNLLALVNPATGRIQHVALPDGTIANDPALAHPDTGALLIGAAIPNWTTMVNLALNAARSFPGLRLQGWDVADTTIGLIPLEVNLVTGRTAYNHQHFMQKGFFDEDMQIAWAALRA
jgi:hypothetical protein